jgi:hypothetical protein
MGNELAPCPSLFLPGSHPADQYHESGFPVVRVPQSHLFFLVPIRDYPIFYYLAVAVFTLKLLLLNSMLYLARTHHCLVVSFSSV